MESYNIERIHKAIKSHLWCPPPRNQTEGVVCALCGLEIDTGSLDYDYAPWTGFICRFCAARFEKEIEALSDL